MSVWTDCNSRMRSVTRVCLLTLYHFKYFMGKELLLCCLIHARWLLCRFSKLTEVRILKTGYTHFFSPSHVAWQAIIRLTIEVSAEIKWVFLFNELGQLHPAARCMVSWSSRPQFTQESRSLLKNVSSGIWRAYLVPRSTGMKPVRIWGQRTPEIQQTSGYPEPD